MSDRSRRWVLAAIGSAIALGGCTVATSPPDPVVVDTRLENGFDSDESVQVEVLVDNRGGSGPILVVVETLDDDGAVLGSHQAEVHIAGDTERWIRLSIVPEDGAVDYRVTVEPVQS